MSKKYTPEEIKNQLSNISEAIGNIALDYITELEKENMELELRIKHITEHLESQAMTALLEQIEEEIKKELNFIKAKEFIKLLLWDLRNKSYDPVVDVERAEQFLKEVDK